MIIKIIIQFIGKLKYFLKDVLELIHRLSFDRSILFNEEYLKKGSIIILINISEIMAINVISNLFEYRNFSFDATLVM